MEQATAPQLRDPRERVSPRARTMWVVGGVFRAVVVTVLVVLGRHDLGLV